MSVVNSYVWSPNFYPGRKGAPILWIVLHDMEAPEGATTAENVAHYFQGQVSASAHYCVDSDSIVQGVHRGDRAWHAGATGNLYGIGYEQAGYARQSRAEWLDPYSRAVIRNTARIAAEDAKDLGIPAVALTDAEVRAKVKRGVVTHAQLSRVFGETSHTDPGSFYPLDVFLADMQSFMGTSPTPAPTPLAQEEAMTLIAFDGDLHAYELHSGLLEHVTAQRADKLKAAGVNVQIVVVPADSPLAKFKRINY